MNHDNNTPLTNDEFDELLRLERMVQSGLDASSAVGRALAAIRDARLYRDTHRTFAAYLRDRWDIRYLRGGASADTEAPALSSEEPARVPVRGDGSQALAGIWEHACQHLGRNDVIAVDVRLTLHKRDSTSQRAQLPPARRRDVTDATSDEVVARLRWLLSHATGTIANVAHQIDTRGDEVDYDAREQLKDDILALDDELATLKATVLVPADWDDEFEDLLTGRIPPFETDGDDPQDP